MYLGAARQIQVQAKTPQQERTATLHSALTTRFPTLGCLLHEARAVSDSRSLFSNGGLGVKACLQAGHLPPLRGEGDPR